jgi:predicted glycosyltransferase
MALAAELCKLDPDVDVQWVSYGTGAATLRENGHEIVDLGLPDDNPFLEAHLRAAWSLARVRPHLVLSHEEFAALPAAKLFRIPTIFITDYFMDETHIWMQCLAYADEILFIDDRGFFDEPPHLREKIRYVGPIARNFAYSRRDRERARLELGIPKDNMLLLVLPGNWSEESAPIFELVASAYVSLPYVGKSLVWIAGQDYGLLQQRLDGYPNVTVKDVDWQIDRWMAAADLAITKGTRKTSLELASLGVPSISLSHGLNEIDDIRVSQIPTNMHLYVKDTDSSALSGHIREILAAGSGHSAPALKTTGLAAAAARLAEHIADIRARHAAVTAHA